MKFERIIPDNKNTYDCFYVERAGDSSITFCLRTDDIHAIKEDFSSVESLTIYDKNGIEKYITSNFSVIKDIRVFLEYMKDEDTGAWLPGIQVEMVPPDLKTEIRKLNAQINPTVDIEVMSVSEYQEYIIKKMRDECSAAIIAGVDVETSQGVLHFSYTLTDQSNLKSLVMRTKESNFNFPYYTSDSLCCILTSEDIIKVWIGCEENLLYQRAYFNALYEYIKTIYTKEELGVIVYGQELTVEYADILNSNIKHHKMFLQTLQNEFTSSLIDN